MLCIGLTALFASFSMNYSSHYMDRGFDDKKEKKIINERVFTEIEINELINSTTVFFLRKEDMVKKDLFEEAVKSVWDFTEIKVDYYGNFNKYQDGNHSFFYISGYNTHVQSDNTNRFGVQQESISFDKPHLFLTLQLPKSGVDKKGNEIDKSLNFCRIELFGGPKTMKHVITHQGYGAIEAIYNGSLINNWSPGMLQVYLKEVQKELKNSRREYLFENFQNPVELKRLSDKTLYIPFYILIKANTVKIQGEENEIHVPDELFQFYPYKFQIISTGEISNKLLQEEEVFVLDYVNSSSDKFIRIFSNKKGKIYQKYAGNSYNLKPKDFKKIFK